MKRRTMLVFAAGVVIASGIVGAKPWLQRQILAPAMGPGRAPSDEAMASFVETYSDPAEPLRILWRSGGINQRDYVLELLKRNQGNEKLYATLRPDLVASIQRLPDQDLRQSIFLLLQKNRDSAIAELASPLLADPDPQTRITALHAFTAVGDPRYLPNVAKLLEDPDENVRVVAEGAVVSMIPQTYVANHQGESMGKMAREYVAANRGAEATVEITGAAGGAERAEIPAPDLHVVDLQGKRVDLAVFRGKKVVVNFFATWCGPCLEELPTLETLADAHRKDLVIIGIAVDAAPDSDGDAPETTPAELHQKLQELKEKYHLSYVLASDLDGQAMNAYGGESLPTSVLIDRDGHVCRRLLGGRTMRAWEAMLASLDGKSR